MASPPAQNQLGRSRYPWTGSNGFEADDSRETLQSSLNKHRLANIVLTQKDRPIPTLDQMKAELAEPVTSRSISQSIKNLQKQHIDDLERLYDIQAGDYITEALEMYYCQDDFYIYGEGDVTGLSTTDFEEGEYMNGDSISKHPETERANALHQLYSAQHQASVWDHAWTDDVSTYRYHHLQALLRLAKQRQRLVLEEEETRKRRELEFPKDGAEFRAKSKEFQQRVAKFLTADKGRQDKMMTEFRWEENRTEALKEVYTTDSKFSAEIRAMVIEVKNRHDDPTSYEFSPIDPESDIENETLAPPPTLPVHVGISAERAEDIERLGPLSSQDISSPLVLPQITGANAVPVAMRRGAKPKTVEIA